MGLTHLLMILHRAEFFVRHKRTVIDIYGYTSATKDVISSEYFFNARTASLSCLFTKFLVTSLSSVMDSVMLVGVGMESLWENLG